MIHLGYNLRTASNAWREHKRNEYFHCFFILGRPSFGITWTLSNNELFNDGKLLSEFTFGKWPD